MQTVKISMNTIFFIISLIFFSGIGLPLHAAWSPPVQISAGPSSINVGATPLVIDSNSVALVGWLDGQIGVAQTLSSANLFPQSTVWTAPQTIYTNTLPELFPSFPTMCIDIFGNQMAVFGLIDQINGSFVLNASRRPFGTTTWLAPIAQTENGLPAGGSLAGDNQGNFAALLPLSTTGGTPPFDITFIQLPSNSSSWLSPLVIAQDNSSQAAVTANAHLNNSVLAWKVNTLTLQLQTTRFNFPTQQFSSIINVPLPPLTTDIVAMDIAVDSHGDAIIIYLAQFASGNALYSSTLLAGENTTWSNPLLISDPANSVVGASIASDAAGNTTILWGEEIMPNQQFIRVTTLPLGGIPTFVTDLTDKNMLNTTVDSTSQVVMDSFGNAAAVWGITISGIPEVQVSSKAVGQNWVTPETLSFTGIFPLIALSDQGTAVVVWIDSITNILMGSRNLFLFDLTPPSNFVGKIIKNEFLTQTNYFLKMHWTRSPAPNVVSYEIFRNGTLIATIPGDGPFEFIQPLHSKHVQSVYTIVATASNGNKSLPITLVVQKKSETSDCELATPGFWRGPTLHFKFD